MKPEIEKLVERIFGTPDGDDGIVAWGGTLAQRAALAAELEEDFEPDPDDPLDGLFIDFTIALKDIAFGRRRIFDFCD